MRRIGYILILATRTVQLIDFDEMVSWWTDPNGRHAYILSWISLLITFSAAIGGIVASIQLNSSLMLVYGLENVVDFISSAIVLWRFFLPAATPLQEARLKAREKRASIGISMVLALLGGGTIITASEDFASGPEVLSNVNSLFFVSFFSTIVFGGLALIKFHFARKLSSPSLRKDGVCSAIGGVLAASVFISTVLTSSTNGSLWWLDPLIALFCGLGSLVYGLYGIYKAYVVDGHPVCKLRWWIYGDQSSTISAPSSANQELEMNVQSSSGGNGVPPTSPEPGNMARDVESRVGDVDELVMT